MAGRTRMGVEERRSQLLAIGTELFAKAPFDDVWIEEVAERAGVSRGLLYHYFPNKRDFFAAVVEMESERLHVLTATDPTLPIVDQLRAGLDAYLDYIEENEAGYRALHRAAVSADAQIRGIVEAGKARQEQRILEGLAAGDRPIEQLRVAVRGWLAFVIEVCLDWLERRPFHRADLRELCVRTLIGAIS